MITPEQLITELKKENEKLTLELGQVQKDMKDFEFLALGWKKGYQETERNLRIQLKNAQLTIEELKNEIEELTRNSFQ